MFPYFPHACKSNKPLPQAHYKHLVITAAQLKRLVMTVFLADLHFHCAVDGGCALRCRSCAALPQAPALANARLHLHT